MPRQWGSRLKKLGKAAQSVADSLAEKNDIDLFPNVDKMIATGKSCRLAASECVEICDTTNEKRLKIIQFGSEINDTFKSLKEKGCDVSAVLETIKDLTDGDRVREAKELAKETNEAARSCVEKSSRMIDEMEQGLESLPDFVKNAIESAADGMKDEGDGVDDEDDVQKLLKGLDRDIKDVETCIDEIQKLNLVTAFKIGMKAFEQLLDKALRSRSMFDAIRGFSKDVMEITTAFKEMDVRTISSKVGDLFQCLNLTNSMRALAEGAGRLIQVVINLFEATSERVSELWAALAFAKNCMLESLGDIREAKTLCLDARDKSLDLIQRSSSVKDKMEAIGELNAESITAIRELSKGGGGEIKEAIDLARGMDDLVINCSGKVVKMVDRVNESFKKLPAILMEGIDPGEAGKEKDDPDPADVEGDIAELEEARETLEKANVMKAARSGVDSFSGVAKKVSVSKDMLQTVEGFTGNCEKMVDLFMNVWDLESATDKITEMCRLVNLGQMIRQFAEQINKLICAVIKLMTAAAKKFSTIGMDNLADLQNAGKDAVNDLQNAGKEAMDDAIDSMKNRFKFLG